MNHLFIINPHSFLHKSHGIDQIISEIKAFFELKKEAYSIHISRSPRDAIIVIRRYFKDMVQNAVPDTRVRVYAVGGDGIVFDCLNGIIGIPNAELAIMPYGAKNDFIRSFGPEHYKKFRNLSMQASARSIPVDLIKCNGNYSLNFCIIGLEAAANINIISLSSRFNYLRRRFQPFSKLLSIIGALSVSFDKRVFGQHYEIDADGENLSGEYHSINIANGRYYGDGMCAVPSAVPDDGLLDMIIIKSISSFKIFRALVAYIQGRWEKYPDYFIFLRVKKLYIRSQTPIFTDLDGEIFFGTDLDIEIKPRMVNVVSVTGEGFK
jgi:YegS/Rv2252/BmrU family lipid kinase